MASYQKLQFLDKQNVDSQAFEHRHNSVERYKVIIK